ARRDDRGSAAWVRARVPHARVYRRSRTRSGTADGRLRADEQSLPGRCRDLRARPRVLSRHLGRRRNQDPPHRRHGTAAPATHIIRALVRGAIIVTVPQVLRRPAVALLVLTMLLAVPRVLVAQSAAPSSAHAGGEASLVLPDLSVVDFHGISGRSLLT